MTNIKEEKIVPFKAQELFNIVADVETYPTFLPWCDAARIIDCNTEATIAELVIQFKGFSERYKSRITHIKEQNFYQINAEAIDGPFSHLTNIWKFTQLNDSTKIEFFIDFKFKSFLKDKLMGMFFETAVKELMQAFEQRAALVCQ